MNFIRIIALGVLLVAGGAQAEEGKKKTPPTAEPVTPPITSAEAPKTCADQCLMMEKLLLEPCKKGAGANKQAQQGCANTTRQMVNACNGSCREKGRIDKQYILERMKPPAGYKPSEGSSNEGEGDAH